MLKRIFILMLIILFCFGLWWFASLPVWQIESVEISGNGYIPLEILAPRAERALGSSLLLLAKNSFDLELPWVRDYAVRRRLFPARALIEIEPRDPLFAVLLDGREYIIDAQGVVLSQLGVSPPSGNAVRVLPLNSLADLEYLAANLPPLVYLLDQIYRRADLRLDISSKNNIQVIAGGGLVLKFGQAVDFEPKYQALKSILADVRSDLPKIQYIDLSSYRTPAVK
ncbi:MAG: cell division protein FtsQ/DivIB [Candidatus Margulisbacteria bacterium]|jgi:cell division septal protein FtsQ|nr:cell division protein FtsQ/DivIB [Candidatus Margulisiibacteriota bacterium]